MQRSFSMTTASSPVGPGRSLSGGLQKRADLVGAQGRIYNNHLPLGKRNSAPIWSPRPERFVDYHFEKNTVHLPRAQRTQSMDYPVSPVPPDTLLEQARQIKSFDCGLKDSNSDISQALQVIDKLASTQSIVQNEMNELRAMFINMARKSDDTGIEASPCSNTSNNDQQPLQPRFLFLKKSDTKFRVEINQLFSDRVFDSGIQTPNPAHSHQEKRRAFGAKRNSLGLGQESLPE